MPQPHTQISQQTNKDVASLLPSPPKKIIRWGMLTLLLLAGLSVMLCCIIPYPEILTADITVLPAAEQDKDHPAKLSLMLHQQSLPDLTTRPLLADRESLSPGQEFMIKAGNYEENGTLHGILIAAPKTCNTDSCTVSLTLPEGFTTSFHKPILLRPGMKGRADVIVRKQSLMSKFISMLTKRIKHI